MVQKLGGDETGADRKRRDVVAALTREKIGTRSQVASDTLRMIIDFVFNQWDTIVEV